MTIVDLKMKHIFLLFGLIGVVDLLMLRSDNGDVTNWYTNLEGRSITEFE